MDWYSFLLLQGKCHIYIHKSQNPSFFYIVHLLIFNNNNCVCVCFMCGYIYLFNLIFILMR